MRDKQKIIFFNVKEKDPEERMRRDGTLWGRANIQRDNS